MAVMLIFDLSFCHNGSINMTDIVILLIEYNVVLGQNIFI